MTVIIGINFDGKFPSGKNLSNSFSQVSGTLCMLRQHTMLIIGLQAGIRAWLITYQFQINYPPLQLLIQGKLGNCKKTGE
ncbi:MULTISPECIES: hypothetical protein [Methylomicrobium]|nr:MULTISPECIES: hypothetical protein [Methylomicrobium]